jgi:uncharacterized OB-fold protein
MGAHVSHPIYQQSMAQRLALEAARCVDCETVTFPPRAVCPDCGAREHEPTTLSGDGEVYSYTVITPGGAPPEFAAQARRTGEFAVAVVELDEGVRITAQLTNVDPSDVEIGLPVSSTIRRLYVEEGVVRYGFKFEPREPDPESGSDSGSDADAGSGSATD